LTILVLARHQKLVNVGSHHKGNTSLLWKRYRLSSSYWGCEYENWLSTSANRNISLILDFLSSLKSLEGLQLRQETNEEPMFTEDFLLW